MPVVFRACHFPCLSFPASWDKVYFFSNEGNPREPVHVHASRADADADAKLWLTPDGRVAESVGFSRREQADLVRSVEARRDDIVRAWHEQFGDFYPL